MVIRGLSTLLIFFRFQSRHRAGLHKQLSGPSKVDKEGLGIPLPAPIRRVLYLGSLKTAETEEIMTANASVLTQLESADAVVYGMGSLYTSICPSLILEVLPWNFLSFAQQISVIVSDMSFFIARIATLQTQ